MTLGRRRGQRFIWQRRGCGLSLGRAVSSISLFVRDVTSLSFFLDTQSWHGREDLGRRFVLEKAWWAKWYRIGRDKESEVVEGNRSRGSTLPNPSPGGQLKPRPPISLMQSRQTLPACSGVGALARLDLPVHCRQLEHRRQRRVPHRGGRVSVHAGRRWDRRAVREGVGRRVGAAGAFGHGGTWRRRALGRYGW